ncbi:MAG: hypothetical protein U1E49_15230 [Hyphomicrobiaceae bacterium]
MPTNSSAAGALSSAPSHGPANSLVRAYFLVSGPAEPGLVPRLAGCVAKLGLTPLRLHASSESGDGSELDCDLRVGALRPDEAERLAGLLRRVVGVRRVVSRVEPAA